MCKARREDERIEQDRKGKPKKKKKKKRKSKTHIEKPKRPRTK